MIALANKPQKLKKRKLTHKQLRRHNFRSGHLAERLAINYLCQHGYLIEASNIRYANHEIDIIALDHNSAELVFIEVKSRSTSCFGHPSLAVKRSKIWSMLYVARVYRRERQHTGDYRLDIVAVVGQHIQHFKNISWNFRSTR